MPILEVLSAAMAASGASSRAEKFLQTAASVAMGATPPAPMPDLQSAGRISSAKVSSEVLAQDVCDEQIARLRVRGIRMHPNAHVVGVKSQEGITVLFAQSGLLHFSGPLPQLSSFKNIDWVGVAETISVTPEGEVQIENKLGVYGSVRQYASTRILLGLEDDCEMYMRSLDVDPADGRVRPLAPRYTIRRGEIEQDAQPPVEIRIALDPIYGIRRCERFASPTPIIIGESVHQNVLLVQHTPSVCMTRIECRNPQDGQVNMYCLSGMRL